VRTLRFRLTGPSTGFDAMMSMLEGVDHVDRIEEVGDLGGGMRDDSSSAELADDDMGDVHDVELHAVSDHWATQARELIEACAMELGMAVEFVDEF
jgi:hypothetical protein